MPLRVAPIQECVWYESVCQNQPHTEGAGLSSCSRPSPRTCAPIPRTSMGVAAVIYQHLLTTRRLATSDSCGSSVSRGMGGTRRAAPSHTGSGPTRGTLRCPAAAGTCHCVGELYRSPEASLAGCECVSKSAQSAVCATESHRPCRFQRGCLGEPPLCHSAAGCIHILQT